MFFKSALKMDEVWGTDPSGLIAYKLDSIEDGRHKTITGELRSEIFHFEIMEAEQKRVWTTPRTAFDLASISHPEQMPTAGEEKNYSSWIRPYAPSPNTYIAEPARKCCPSTSSQ